MQDQKLAEKLLADGKINESQLSQATQMQEATGGELAPILVKMGFVSGAEMTELLSELEGVKIVDDLQNTILPEALVKSIPRDLIERHLVIPIAKEGNRITLAMVDAEDFDAINEIQFLTGMKLELVVASKESIRKAITQFFYTDDSDAERTAGPEASDDAAVDGEGQTADLVMSDDPQDLSEWQLKAALIPLLIDKGVITEDELRQKAMDLESTVQETPQG